MPLSRWHLSAWCPGSGDATALTLIARNQNVGSGKRWEISRGRRPLTRTGGCEIITWLSIEIRNEALASFSQDCIVLDSALRDSEVPRHGTAEELTCLKLN